MSLHSVVAGLCAVALVLAAGAVPARGGFIQRDLTLDEIASGTLTEKGPQGSVVVIGWTTVTGAIATGDGSVVGPVTIDAGGSVDFKIPVSINGDLIDDVVQDLMRPDPGTSTLRIEAFTISGPDLIVTRFTSAIYETLGASVVRIPDLFADTNGDGVIDDNDHLYAAVNLYPYMAGVGTGSFNLGDSFNIVDGVSSALPGMVFGTAPITLSDTSSDGFDNPDPFTGEGVAGGEHDGTVVPEPAALALLGFGGLGLLARRLRRPSLPDYAGDKTTMPDLSGSARRLRTSIGEMTGLVARAGPAVHGRG